MSILYFSLTLLLATYVASTATLLVLYFSRRSHNYNYTPRTRSQPNTPSVTVQLPIFNEQFVVTRLLRSVVALNYPRDRIIIQILDDSTDSTTQLITQEVEQMQHDGFTVQHIRRGSRTGFKAGALAYGLTQTTSPYVAIFDADFVPPSDFLMKIIPYLEANPRVGMAQGRWGHLNPHERLLTVCQTLVIDAHFVIEQTSRSRNNLLTNFNGTGGVWRVQAIHEAGGWQDNTLTEDLDLSYRAQLVGWKMMTLPDIVVPGELPTTISAYKQQQSRWAKGNTQVLLNSFLPVWQSSHLSHFQKLMASVQLCQYITQPIVVLLTVLTPPLAAADKLQGFPVWFSIIITIITLAMYFTSQHFCTRRWWARLWALPVMFAIATGITLRNSIAVSAAFIVPADANVFHRTPKNGDTQNDSYSVTESQVIFGELLLAVYVFVGAWFAYATSSPALPYLLFSGFSYAWVAIWELNERQRSYRLQSEDELVGIGD